MKFFQTKFASAAKSARFTARKQCVIGVLLIGVQMVPFAAYADIAGEVLRCKGISEDSGRLACYDAISAEAQKKTTQGVQEIPGTAGKFGDGTQVFGQESVVHDVKTQPQTLTAKIDGSVRGIRKGMLIHLNNGQAWRCVDDREVDFDAESPEVTIDRNLIGSYWMTLADSGYRVRVRRVK